MDRRRLTGEWYLTDGILPPIRLSEPARAGDALKEAGVIQAKCRGLKSLDCEWVMRRKWLYTLKATNAQAFEPRARIRRFLRLTELYGTYNVRLDGETALSSDQPCATIELTRAPELIQIEFAPDDCAEQAPCAGFAGDAFIITTGAAAITHFSVNQNDNNEMCARATIDSSEAGECELIYTLRAPGGEARKHAARVNFESVGAQTFTNIPFTKLKAGVKYEIELRASFMGALSDEMAVGAILFAAKPRGFAIDARADITLIARAGGNAAVMPDTREHRRLVHECGLTLCDYTTARALPAPQLARDMRDMAQDEPYLPPTTLVWALSGSRADAFERGEADDEYDIEQAIMLSRFRQAEALRFDAQSARSANKPFLVGDAMDAHFKYASCALFDNENAPRPAYYALMDAWQPAHAYARADEATSDNIISLNIYCARDAGAGAYMVRARAYSLAGEELAAASLPVITPDGAPLGRFAAQLLKDGYLIVRLTVLNEMGEAISRSDTFINARGAALKDISRSQLLITREYAQNTGDTALIGVSADFTQRGGFWGYGALLPDEKLTFDTARERRIEALNIL